MCETLELSSQASPADREIDELGDALAGVVVYDVEDSQSPPISELIGHEIHRPALRDGVGHAHRYPRPHQPLAALGADLEAFFAVDSVGPLRVDDPSFGLEHVV